MKNDQSIYSKFAKVWWTGRHRWLRTLHNLVSARLEAFDPWLGDWRGKTVLDLGCGGGFMAEAMARRGATVIGVDPNSDALSIAKEHACSQGLYIDYRMGSGEALPVTSRSLDCVVCVDTLEHVVNLEQLLQEVARVLKPGGKFLFDTINRNWLSNFIVVFLGEVVLRVLVRGTHDPKKFIKPSELASKAADKGFINFEVRGLGPRGLDNRYDFTFGRLPTTAIMYLGQATLGWDR